jgi:hypothetical protein
VIAVQVAVEVSVAIEVAVDFAVAHGRQPANIAGSSRSYSRLTTE